jgi:thiamine-phosphate pyrophosphorylase
MRPELTPAVLRALEAAQRYAHGHVELRPVHLLQGLLEEEEGHAALLCIAAGLDLGRGRSALGVAGEGASPTLPLGALARDALIRARDIVLSFTGESAVASDALLLALLRSDDALRQHLEGLGLVFARLEAEVARRQPPPPQLDEPLDLTDVTERTDTARILDAVANRAREALRVVEDYIRFVLDDAYLSRQLKQMRHDLTAALADLGPEELLAARETLRDVGTEISTASEQERSSTQEVLRANLKRLQEALRSLEEFAKVSSAPLGQALERLRYRSYTLERAIVLGSSAREKLRDARLYVLLSRASCASALDWTIAEIAAGGAHVVQLREKGLPDRELLGLARQARQWAHKAGLLFLVNDRPDIARLVGADGVHLGQDDMPVKEARRILGPEPLIGVSTHDLDQVRQAVLDGASYLGIGPTFPSGTKPFDQFPGLDFVRAALAETTLPAFVIGGINRHTVAGAVAAGADRVAVSQAIAAAESPRAATVELLRALAGG